MQYWGGIDYHPERGQLRLGGTDALTLAKAYGTPLVVLNAAVIRDQCRRYRQAFADAGVNDFVVAFAGKAFCTLAMCQLVAEEAMALDVVSGGELYTALTAGFPPERIIFHGNNKTVDELREAVEAGVGRIVVDNGVELARLAELSVTTGQRIRILLRVVPDVTAETHASIDTGRRDNKFGFDINSGAARQAIEQALAVPSLQLAGLHIHIGSQIMSLTPYREAVRRLMSFAAEIREAYGLEPEELDLGGGLGVRYLPSDQPPSIEQLVGALVEQVRSHCDHYQLPMPRLLVEPGRSIVAEAGVTLYTVGTIKRLPELPTYVAVDGGMMDNPRPVLYDAEYTALLVTPPGTTAPSERNQERLHVVGRACESGDILVRNVVLPMPQTGDVIALLTTGAYTYSMASHYNKFPRPAVVLLDPDQGKARVIVERERYQDLIRHERPLRSNPRVAATPTRVGRLSVGRSSSPPA